MERGEIGEMGSVGEGVANVDKAADDVEVTGVDIEFVSGNARGDGENPLPPWASALPMSNEPPMTLR